MASTMKFPSIHRIPPVTRPSEERITDFLEIHINHALPTVNQQASRCAQCGIPTCHTACPLNNHIPEWLKLATENRWKEAYHLSTATNCFPEICGRICPQELLCEGSCTINGQIGAVTIGSVEQEITENAWRQGWVIPIIPPQETKLSIGVIGAGPAGLAAAIYLRSWGYDVHIYEKNNHVGGLLTYGIPGFKLDKAIVFRREKWMRASGIRFHTNTEVGKTLSFQQLKTTHQALLIATGVWQAKPSTINGRQLKNIVDALDYLSAANRHLIDEKSQKNNEPELFNAKDQVVVVIGGGDTAMDCVRTAIRQKAKSVVCLYRRDKENMPGSPKERINAEQEGVRFQWLAIPQRYLGSTTVTGVQFNHAELVPDPLNTRRYKPITIPKAVETIPASMVIEALGFQADDSRDLFSEPQLAVHPNLLIQTPSGSCATNIPGIFAAGDISRGASLVVWTIYDGQRSAFEIDQYLKTREYCATVE